MLQASDLRGVVLSARVELTVPPRRRHLWSPQLAVRLEKIPEGTRLHGRFGPHPHVWTMYVALVALAIFIAVGSIMYGTAQWMIDQEPSGLWFTLVALGITTGVILLAKLGQIFGAEQMMTLRREIEAIAKADPRS
ncbi:MAG: hypothetical protein AAGE52_27805 [Myxococcota bacterium]